MDIHSRLRGQFPAAISKTCKRGECRLGIDGLGSCTVTIVDADEYKKVQNYSGSICDFFLFLTGSGLTAAAVEMKEGEVHMSKAEEQLKNGARICETLVASEIRCEFHAILLHRGNIHASATKILDRRGIRFRGRPCAIVNKRCGAHLADIL